MWYGKNDDDFTPTPRNQSNDESEVRFTTRYCNKDSDYYPTRYNVTPAVVNKQIINLNVGDYVKGLGRVIKVTKSNDVVTQPKKENGNCLGVTKQNFIKWLTAHNFKFDYNQKTIDIYYLETNVIDIIVYIQNDGFIFVESDSIVGDAKKFKTTKEAGMFIKVLL